MEQVRLITDLAGWIPRLEQAMDHDVDGHSVLEVVERVRSGEFLAVEVDGKGLLVVEILERENRVLNVVVCAGWQMPRWIARAVGFLRSMAADQGCPKIRVQGRPGWVRVLSGFGFVRRATILELSHG